MKRRMFAAACFSLIFAIFSVYCLLQEAGPFLRQRVQTSEAFLLNERLNYGYSSYSKYLTLDDCLGGMQTLPVTVESMSAKRRFDQDCATVSAEIVSTMPTNSFAWLINATAQAARAEFAEFNSSLRQSQLTGPNEGWIAEWRLRSARKFPLVLEPETLAAEDKDIFMLANSHWGIRILAGLYRADNGFQERLVAIIEKLPKTRQLEFFYEVKKVGQQG